jgi:RNA polymerase sigma-54 factor
MVLLQNKLNLRVSQKQILTPGLVQMVSVLALNKLELRDMITAEMVENPVLDELETQVPSLDELSAREEKRDRIEATSDEPVAAEADKKDPFDEIDFGSFFRDYLDPGHRTYSDIESIERPSFENFLSRPTTLTDHLMWQLGSLQMTGDVREAAERIIGNLNEDGYLTASDDELRGIVAAAPEKVVEEVLPKEEFEAELAGVFDLSASPNGADEPEAVSDVLDDDLPTVTAAVIPAPTPSALRIVGGRDTANSEAAATRKPPVAKVLSEKCLRDALNLVHSMDPIGVAARNLRECLLLQLQHHAQLHSQGKKQNGNGTSQVIADCIAIVDAHIKALQSKQYKEIARAIGRPLEAVMQAFEFIRRLDPKPGARYNQIAPRLIEPDAAFVKHGDEWLVMMNEDDLPQLRLNPTYKRLLQKEAAEKDVRNYVKERYKSAIQLIKNIEQRKQTILKVCYSIIERQRDFLEHGIDQLKPMMIKEVAEEIGVHPSTVSRAVANKYCHTPQGVFELRYFFSESVNGPEGGGTSLLILKRRVKKLIEEEDPAHPYTDDQITRILQSQGIQVTRRTVAKYREDMRIPSTHQRRVKD